MISLRVDPKDFAAWEAAALAEEIERSQWIRQNLNAAVKKTSPS